MNSFHPETWQTRLYPLLAPVSVVYSMFMRMRRVMYESGLLPRHNPGCPTVCVGNIGWGGSGKTEVCSWLTKWALSRGIAPVVLSRGYKGSPPALPFKVEPGADPALSGDEPALLARSHPKATVLVDPKRSRAAEAAKKRFSPSLMIMDDGFSHLALIRHVNLVLLRPADLADQWNRVIPAGSWREGKSALKRADAFLIKLPEDQYPPFSELIRARLEKFHKPVFAFDYRVTGLERLNSNERVSDLGGRPYLLISAVAEPDQVYATAARCLDYPPGEHLAYPDHHELGPDEWSNITSRARRLGVDDIVCTGQDAVKISPDPDDRVWVLRPKINFHKNLNAPPFSEWWENLWQKIS